jgi:hypothetical protein
VNAKQIARIIEVLFQGDPGGEAPEPLKKRFQWKNPATGKAPPRMPKEVIPTEKDMRGLDTEFAVPPGHDSPPVHRHDPQTPGSPAAAGGLPDDRTGSVPMSGMIGKGEMATIDDLLDTYLQMQKTQGPAAAKAWFDRYRTAEFESILNRVVDALMG